MAAASNNTPKKKATKKKANKTPSKYEEKFVITGTFEEVMKQLVTPKNTIKKSS